MSYKIPPDHKRFHKTDTLLYCFTTMDIKPSCSLDPIEHKFVRHGVHAHASPLVGWRNIVEEFHAYWDCARSLFGTPLLTCLADYPDFILALTPEGFKQALSYTTNPDHSPYQYFRAVDHLAKELVMMRDYQAYLNDPSQPLGRCQTDFFPKD